MMTKDVLKRAPALMALALAASIGGPAIAQDAGDPGSIRAADAEYSPYLSWGAALLSAERRRSFYAPANVEDRRSAERRQHDSDSIDCLRFLGEVYVL